MNVLIIEDERIAAQRLAKLLTELDENIQVSNFIEGVEEAVQYLKDNIEPDVIFMDIQLADGISFEIFDLIQITCPVIFTTAYDEYALEAFRVHALDYLLKPIKRPEVAAVLDRLSTHQIRSNNDLTNFGHPAQVKKVLIKLGHRLKVITLNEARFYYSENKITFYMGDEGKRYPLDLSLDKLEAEIDPNQFFRVNRQFIVNQEAIKGMVSYSANRIKLQLEPNPPSDVIVSKDKVSRFRKWLVS